MEEEKPKNPEKNLQSKVKTQNKLNQHIALGGNPSLATIWWKANTLNAVPNPYSTKLY